MSIRQPIRVDPAPNSRREKFRAVAPSIDVVYPQKGYIYLKEFSGFNNLHNVTSENNSFTLYFEDSNGNQVQTDLLDIQATNYPSLKKLVEAIENKINSLQVGDPAEAEAKGLQFSIVDQKVRVFHVTQKFKLEGFIFNDLIDIPFSDTYAGAQDSHRRAPKAGPATILEFSSLVRG